MQVYVTVHEADIYQVEVGQKVLITLDTHKGKVFHGEVIKIATVASSSGWDSQNNRRFRVDIDMESVAETMRAGITARVEILIDQIESVLQVPIHSVHTEGDEHFCFVVNGSKPERTLVEVGRSSAHYVEISSGLAEGDRVLLYDPRDEGMSSEEGDDAEDDEATPTTPMMEAAG